jgi:hypothetical protein
MKNRIWNKLPLFPPRCRRGGLLRIRRQARETETEARAAFSHARRHYSRYRSPFSPTGWEYGAPDVDPRIEATVELIGRWSRIAALAENSRDLPFALREFIKFWPVEVAAAPP